MGEHTKIEWATHTFNPWEGCTKVSPGCAHCYAENRNVRFAGGANWGPDAPRRRTEPANWKKPQRWDREHAAAVNDRPGATLAAPRVFCASLADWLDSEVPAAWRHDLLDLIDTTRGLTWLLLTKRPQEWGMAIEACAARGSSLAQRWLAGVPPANVHFGVTVEDQARADERRKLLRAVPAEFYFVSYEPALSPVDWSGFEFIDQLICGGESGQGARPMHPAWARTAREWCERSDVSFFFKQWGEWLPEHQEPATASRTGAHARAVHTFEDGVKTYRVGKICAGRTLDGVEYHQLPVPF